LQGLINPRVDVEKVCFCRGFSITLLHAHFLISKKIGCAKQLLTYFVKSGFPLSTFPIVNLPFPCIYLPFSSMVVGNVGKVTGGQGEALEERYKSCK